MPFDFSPDYTVPAEDLEAARILREAARYIEEHGWCQYSMEDSIGNVCALGSLYAVASNRCTTLGELVADHLQYEGWTDTPLRRLAQWNDTPSRTKEEVITALTGCAEWLESGRPDR